MSQIDEHMAEVLALCAQHKTFPEIARDCQFSRARVNQLVTIATKRGYLATRVEGRRVEYVLTAGGRDFLEGP